MVARQKVRKTRCARAPHLALTISQTVCALGAFRLISMAMIPKRSTCTVAPLAYQKGPLTPYCHATLELCRMVAAHVHCDTITLAISPVFTLRPAVLNYSDVCSCDPPT